MVCRRLWHLKGRSRWIRLRHSESSREPRNLYSIPGIAHLGCHLPRELSARQNLRPAPRNIQQWQPIPGDAEPDSRPSRIVHGRNSALLSHERPPCLCQHSYIECFRWSRDWRAHSQLDILPWESWPPQRQDQKSPLHLRCRRQSSKHDGACPAQHWLPNRHWQEIRQGERAPAQRSSSKGQQPHLWLSLQGEEFLPELSRGSCPAWTSRRHPACVLQHFENHGLHPVRQVPAEWQGASTGSSDDPQSALLAWLPKAWDHEGFFEPRSRQHSATAYQTFRITEYPWAEQIKRT